MNCNENFKNMILRIYPMNRESKIRFKRDVKSPPMTEGLKKFFESNNAVDSRVFLNLTDLFGNPGVEKWNKTFPNCQITAEEWETGLKNGMKLKKALVQAIAPNTSDKEASETLFNAFYKTSYENVMALRTTGKEEIQLMISRNPLDFYFASASPSFTSCMDVTNGSHAGIYGLFQGLADPSRILVARVKGNQFIQFDGKLFKVPYILSRSFSYVDEKNHGFTCARWYNGENIDHKKMAELIYPEAESRKFVEGTPFTPYVSKYSTKAGTGIIVMPWQDCIAFKNSGRTLQVSEDLKGSSHAFTGGLTTNFTFDYKTNSLKHPGDRESNAELFRFNPRYGLKEVKSGLPSILEGLEYITENGERFQGIFCGSCGAFIRQKDSHSCNEVKTVKDTFFGATTEKTYKVKTSRKTILTFPRSKVVEFMKAGDISLRSGNLYLKGVA